MLIDFWTYGAIDTSDVALRQASGIPQSEGTNFAAMDRAITALFGAQLGGLLYSEANGTGNRQMTGAQLKAYLAKGGGVVACGYYKDLPTHYRRWSPNFGGGHAAYVQGVGDTLRWFDPLAAGDASYRGEAMTWDVLWGFIWTSGSMDPTKNFVTAAHAFEKPRLEPSRFLDVPRLSSFYDDIVWAADNGILMGIGRGLFAPDRPLTRAQAAVVCRRLANFVKGDA